MGGTGILLMAFGGPDSLDAVGPFMTNLMGREPSPEALERVRRRYLTIGGLSPLPAIARGIAEKLGEELETRGHAMPVKVGMLHWNPTIASALAEFAAAGIDRVIAVSLSPFESSHSSGGYRKAVEAALSELPGMTVVEAPSFRDQPGFIDALARGCNDALEELPEGSKKAVLFSAHSLPASELNGDPYVSELRETASVVAQRAALPRVAADGSQSWLPGIEAYGSDSAEVPWLFCYQSKGMRPGDWLGPEVIEVVDAIADAGYEGVAFCPIGFATDHMETLYDLDVEACGRALDRGLEYARAAVPNDAPEMVEALAEVVEPLL